MFKHSLFLLLLIAAIGNANAQVFKCKGPDGKTQFSDTACKTGINSEIVPDRAPVTKQQQYDAQQRAARLQDESASLDQTKAGAQAEQQAQQQGQETAKQVTPAANGVNDSEAISNCVKDVERRGASQNVKAEMIAACRTAGFSQRSTGTSSEAVQTCVKNVERTGASEKEKTRQLATCHGGDVKPEPTTITSCDRDDCRDNQGNHYKKVGPNLVGTNGNICQTIGNRLHCD